MILILLSMNLLGSLSGPPCICGDKTIKDHMVDFVLGESYQEVNLDDNPSLLEPFSIDNIKTHASCRGPVSDIARYRRLVRRALLDESTKMLILYVNREYVPSCARTSPTKFTVSANHKGRWAEMLGLRQRIDRDRKRVTPEEQPYSRVRNLVTTARRRERPTEESFQPAPDILQMKGTPFRPLPSLYGSISLYLRTFLGLHRDAAKRSQTVIVIDLSRARKECKSLSIRRRGYIFLAQLHSFERSYAASSKVAEQHVVHAKEALDHAKGLCVFWPGHTRGLMEEIEGVEKMLRGTTFYTPVTNEERIAVIAATAREFRGTGHWYYCRNGHPFTIGECGMAMRRSVCPECGEPVGQESHAAAEGVTHARDLEEGMERMRLE
ncbi:uncharacterized protein BO97DRAFT_430713 [Aspergillus homomorphus CBS 101889]|uniref:RZ-type domain-containing protein n=1 Tax=Aspergillus homomorphus (strain CBS 101889) TaxID=1450537 RepID=A0A395ICK8_ASPHC|nr:hypothetical protein BO97DRAFT_430713 [Aspergillus homomorphus CBS 101889]RAL17771.1 hypothetical protein BO97DRAFT_430713 [Aspergillus homomorphus CBS 101889]